MKYLTKFKMAAISKEEYLKRYLSNADSGEKKRRKKKVKTGIKTGKSLIIDDDVNLSDIKVKHDAGTAENLLDLADETPLIFNETGTTVLSKDLESIRKKEDEKKAMWAPVKTVEDETFGKDFSPVRSRTGTSPGKSSQFARNSLEERTISGKGVKNQRRHDSEDLSPRRQRISHNSSSEESSARRLAEEMPSRNTRHGSPEHLHQRSSSNGRSRLQADQSPPRRKRHDSSSDRSPPRTNQPVGNRPKRTRHDSPDMSPPRKIVNNRSASPGKSPPRRNRHDSSPDQSPPRRNRHNSSPDQSPPRNNRKTGNIPKRTRHDSPDLSPQRKAKNKSISPDQSPPRRQKALDRRNRSSGRERHDSPDLSPPRKSGQSPQDQSPPRKPGHKRSLKDGRNRHSPDLSPPRKQRNSERKAGLHSAAELREENERMKQRENEMFSKMNSSTTGKGAETVHRDKAGRKRDFQVEKAKQREEERKKEEENEKFVKWGKGVHQSKTAKEKVDDDLYEMSKPLARYKDDEDLDEMLRNRERAEDPMLAFVQKKKVKQDVLAGKKEKPRYKGPPPPPNRFNILPGYRWDGVDRSNGFEKKRFSMLANKGASNEEAYKWSIEDM